MKRKSAEKIVKDNVVLCEKRMEKNSVSIWVVDNPEIRAEAKKLSQAEEELVNTIWDIFELDEPFAINYKDDDQGLSVSKNPLFWIGSNELIDTGNPSQYFKGGYCPTCHKGIGGRNNELLTLEGVPKGVKSGFIVRFETASGLKKGANIIHVDICKTINKTCQPFLEFRQVMDKKRGLTNYCEIVPTRYFFEVSPIGQKEPGGKCVECGSVRLYGEVDKNYIKRSDADLIRLHGAAAIGNFAPKFCVSSLVWESVKKLEVARRLLKLCPMIELEEKDIDPNPKFEKIRAN